MKALPGAFWLVVLAAGPPAYRSRAAGPTTRATTRPGTFTVATYNINGLNRHLPEVIANIRKTKADVACLQEVNRGSAGELRRALRSDYPFIETALNHRVDGFALLSKSPVTHRQWVPAKEIGYHSLLHARTRLGGRDVQVVVVHLVPNIPRPGASAGDQVRHMLRLEGQRNEEIRRIAKRFSRDRPVLAMGDFNCLSFQGAVTYMKARGFVDAVAAVHNQPDALPTWQGRFQGREMRLRIDYVFHTAQFRTLAAGVLTAEGSDHFPLVATLTWAAPAGPAGAAPRAGRR